MAYTYYKHCGCEYGEDCTKVSQCALNAAVEACEEEHAAKYEELTVTLEQYERVRRERDKLARKLKELADACGNIQGYLP